MLFSEYLQQQGASQAVIGRAVGVSQARVSQWLAGALIPEDKCAAVEAATGGAVRCEELRPDVDWTRDDQGRVTGYHVRIDPPAMPVERVA